MSRKLLTLAALFTVTLASRSMASDTTPPSAPTYLMVGNYASGSSAVLTWSPSTDDSSRVLYNIYRGGTLMGSTSLGSGITQVTLFGLSTSCGAWWVTAEDEAYNVSEPSNVVMVILDGCSIPTPLIFDNGDANAADPAEWDPYYYKADCGASEAASGLSQRTDLSAAHALLCKGHGTFTGESAAVITDVSWGEHRRGSRDPDWDYGYFKSECGLYEYVSGISMDPWSMKLHGLRCASGPDLWMGGASNCETRLVVQEDRGETLYGDWDPGYFKAECGPGKVIFGVSTEPSTGMPHGILCCSF